MALQLEQIDKEVVIGGITRQDIQDIFTREFEKRGLQGNRVIFFDVSYLMNFYARDMEYIQKVTWATRFDIGLMKDWHRQVERWYLDQTVRDDFGRLLRPIDILRKVDKVPNEGLEEIAEGIVAGGGGGFIYNAIGEGIGSKPYPSDKGCILEIDRINIPQDSIGGSVNRDGSTIYWVANHDKQVQTADVTEGSIHNTSDLSTDKCMNHTIFDGYVIEHTQGVDAISRTTTLYMCSV
jgi:hypothetical protein